MTIKIKQNLGKKEISNNIKSSIGFSSKHMQKITDDIIETIATILVEEKKINIKNFGSLNIVYKKEREGRNPKTKVQHTIKPRYTVRFIASNTLKKKINEI